MARTIRINPLTVSSYGEGDQGTILVTKQFGRTQVFILSDRVQQVKARLERIRGLFPGFVEFELASVEAGQ